MAGQRRPHRHRGGADGALAAHHPLSQRRAGQGPGAARHPRPADGNLRRPVQHQLLGKGDRINLVYETLLYNGAPIAAGNLLAVEIKRAGKLHQAFYFAHDSESGAYYDAQGKPIKQGFSQQPVANARISSGFGFRKHPILRSLRLHSGVDYAAASGTPSSPRRRHPGQGGAPERLWQYGGNPPQSENDHAVRAHEPVRQGRPRRQERQGRRSDRLCRQHRPLHRPAPALRSADQRPGGGPATNALPTPGLSSTQLAEFKSGNRQLTAHLQLLRELPTNIALLD